MVEKKESFDEKCRRLGLFDKSMNDNMRKIFDGLMAILPPEYFVKEDSDG